MKPKDLKFVVSLDIQYVHANPCLSLYCPTISLRFMLEGCPNFPKKAT